MKKKICLFCCFILLCTAAGCGNSNNAVSTRTGNQSPGVKDVLEAGIGENNGPTEPIAQNPAEENNAEQNSETAAAISAGGSLNSEEAKSPEAEATAEPLNSGTAEIPETEPAGQPDNAETGYEMIDVDLTALSSTLVYAEVYNMMMTPDQYIGKTVKMGGPCSIYIDESTRKIYYACVIADATACCAQGIEFVLTDDYRLPDDYPRQGDDICVIGVFDTYQEGGYTYCTLRNAKLL